MTQPDPPLLLQRFFRWFCRDTHLEGLEGDLFELFDRRVERQGARMARWLYLFDMISLLRSTVARPLKSNSKLDFMGMLNNYIKTALRIAWKRKTFSAINLLGLTVGITCVVFIAIYVQDEFSYDQHITDLHTKYRIYNRVDRDNGISSSFPIVPPTFAPSLKESFPQFSKIGRLFEDYGGTVFQVGDQVFSEKNGVYAEQSVLEMLDVDLSAGNLDDLNAPRTMLLSASMFEKFFGDVAFDNQTVQLTRSTVEIVGVYEDFPRQSHIRPDYIFSFEWLVSSVSEERMNSWRWQQFYTYFQTVDGVDPQELQNQVQEHVASIAHPITSAVGLTYLPYFQPLADIHLHSANFQWEIAEVGSYQSTLFLTIAALIILLIACLNFVNLTTAQSIKRAREVGIRKFVGASRRQLILQSQIESFLYCLAAGMLALGLVGLNLTAFNQFTSKSFELQDIFTGVNLLVFSGGLLALSFLSGWYPSLVILRFSPLAVLHGAGSSKIGLRARKLRVDSQQWLVGGQYALSIGLILVALIFSDQYQYLTKKDMGFRKENLLTLPLTRSLRQNQEAVRAAFGNHPGVESISLCYGIPGDVVAGDGAFFPELIDTELSSNMFIVDRQYIETMGMRMIAGRQFSEDLSTDDSQAFIINETAVKNLGLASAEEAIGQSVKWKMWVAKDTFKMGRVVGVVADFNYKSLHNEIENVIMHISPDHFSYMIAKLHGDHLVDAIDHLEEVYQGYEPTRPFEYQFVDQSFARFYVAEQRVQRLFSLFALLAILTAAIGLYGLVSFSVVSRSKEISIRKVLGAGVPVIFELLVKRYFVLVLVAMCLALPLSYFIASRWLEGFAYAVDITPQVFVKVCVITMLLTILTVGYQALRGAAANPADKLRNE